MTSTTKPYLIRAIHEWCSDHGYTAYLAVHVDDRTRVPKEFVRDGQIVLNVSTEATHQLVMGNDEISFQTRFNGASFPVLVPIDAVAAIYARENGQGIAFDVNQSEQVALADDGGTELKSDDTVEIASPSEPTPRRVSHLTRVK